MDERAKTLVVSAAKVGFIDRIGEAKQKLKWTFETDGHFAYGIYYCKDPGEIDVNKMECVYPRFNVRENAIIRFLFIFFRKYLDLHLSLFVMKSFYHILGLTSFGSPMNMPGSIL